jgi:Carboxypeptidase regulatory-like domain
VCLLCCAIPVLGRAQSRAAAEVGAAGSISGTIVDPSGAAIIGAQVKLTRGDSSANRETLSSEDGLFYFGDVTPGPYRITVTSEGFSPQALSGTLQPGEVRVAPQITLALAAEKIEMQVVIPGVEIAQEQISEEEKQRVLGFVPNFYVSYVPDAVPLTSKQKFKLALRATVDPVTFILTGAVAGVQQSRNVFPAYGQGAQGYGKRYGANYADMVTSTFIGSAVLPSILKQDPRYFYKASGSARSRIFYAMAMAVVCKGDNGRWQPNYWSILGSLAAGGLSNFYYPAEDRHDASLTFENTAIGIGTTAAANLLQEFVIRKLTPSVRNRGHSQQP